MKRAVVLKNIQFIRSLIEWCKTECDMRNLTAQAYIEWLNQQAPLYGYIRRFLSQNSDGIAVCQHQGIGVGMAVEERCIELLNQN